jgi:hypothetical protein
LGKLRGSKRAWCEERAWEKVWDSKAKRAAGVRTVRAFSRRLSALMTCHEA